MAPAVPGYDYVPDLMTDLEQGFKKNVILMIVRDQHIVDKVGKIELGIAVKHCSRMRS